MVCKASTRLCGPTFPRDFSLWCCQTLFRHRPLQRRRRELRRLEDESASYSSNVCWAPDPSLFSSRTSRHSKARILTNPDIITSFKARSKYIWEKKPILPNPESKIYDFCIGIWKDNGRIALKWIIYNPDLRRLHEKENYVQFNRRHILPEILWKYQSSWLAIHLLQFAKRLANDVDWHDPQFCDNRLLFRLQTNVWVYQSHCGHYCGYHHCSTLRCVFSCRDNL